VVDDVLASWAVPKGPRRTETFEGVIPEGPYGAGRVILWHRGTYIGTYIGTYSNESQYDMSEGLKRGHLSFWLNGQKLRAGDALTHIRGGVDETWLLVKKSDEYADALSNPVRSQPESVLSGRTLADLS
jgi:ATP-dependent DNA ligase